MSQNGTFKQDSKKAYLKEIITNMKFQNNQQSRRAQQPNCQSKKIRKETISRNWRELCRDGHVKKGSDI